MTDRATRLARLESLLRRTWLTRRLLFYGSTVFPAFVALVLAFLALYPMLFSPGENLIGTLGTLVAGGLSFSGVSFAAAASRHTEKNRSLEMATAGSILLRFAIAMAVALALAAARQRVVADIGEGGWPDFVLRGAMVLVTGAAIGLGFFGFHSLVLLHGPTLEEEEAERLRGADEVGSAAPEEADEE